MKTAILSALEPLPYFTIEAVKQLMDDGSYSPGSIQTALYRWTKSGQVVQLKKGVYMTNRFQDLHHAEPDFSAAVSAILLPQSYLSLEFVLQQRAILTDVTYPVTAVTFKNTRAIENKLGAFIYRHIKTALFTGFTIRDFHGIPFAIASPAKALFDLLYLRPALSPLRPREMNLAEELRLNLDEMTQVERDEFREYIQLSNSKKMQAILRNLEVHTWQP
jgi:predicted transcriptional regulator of viral defense system